MLTGMIAPTSGAGSVLGLDLETQLDQIRQMMGVCPQHDILFPLLTVKVRVVTF